MVWHAYCVVLKRKRCKLRREKFIELNFCDWRTLETQGQRQDLFAIAFLKEKEL